MSQDEFESIRTWFAPLAGNPAARGLRDDAALIDFGGPVVLTSDCLVEGVHFLASDPLDSIAQKALRVNLSDLAAKAARPIGYLMALHWPRARPGAEIALLAQGLARDQRQFGLDLLGGDTVSTPGPLSISISMFGTPVGTRVPDRRDARIGQDVWISGVIGEGWLGLQVALRGHGDRDVLQHYRCPRPRLELAACLASFAGAALDVSDGLLADCAKLADASNLAIEIALCDIPHSRAGHAFISAAPDAQAARLQLAAGGDDYEILFTADPSARPALQHAAKDLGLPLTCIGQILAGRGLTLRDDRGAAVALGNLGYAHRLGC